MKSIIILAVCLAASALLKAQQVVEVKAEIAPVSEIKPPLPADVNKIQAPQTNQTEAAAGIKSGKPVLLQEPVNNPNSSLTPEQLKTANGTAQKPVMAVPPGTEQKSAKPRPVIITPPVAQ
ncbi:MAG: hypothetical protein IPL84_03310 [Chitinophagaceae bacterium]|nr:hypothetical protein [Chitinophagaceae bacterium]